MKYLEEECGCEYSQEKDYWLLAILLILAVPMALWVLGLVGAIMVAAWVVVTYAVS